MESLTMDEETPTPSLVSFPVLPQSDLTQVAQTILQLFDPVTSSNPAQAKYLQSELQKIQGTPEAWGLIAGLASHEDTNVRFFGAHTAQVKISRDWDTLPQELHQSLLALLLETLSGAINPQNPYSYQPGNAVVIRKIFGSLASLLLRLEFTIFSHPIHTVIQSMQSSFAQANAQNIGVNLALRLRLLELEWCAICVEEMGRAGLAEQRRAAIRRHVESDLKVVVRTVIRSMNGDNASSTDERLREAEAACKCAESWIDWGLGADELNEVLPVLYNLLPLPAACSAVVEVLSESIFKYGKGTKILTEPLISWATGPSGQSILDLTEEDASEEAVAFVKLVAALVEHSSDWLVAHIQESQVQTFLAMVLRITGWKGIAGVEENISELTLPIYSLLQEALMDSDLFQAPHETHPAWLIAKQFFAELVSVTRRKVRWPGEGEVPQGGTLGGLEKDDREAFSRWRRDAGEVVVGAYYVLREEMMQKLTQTAAQQIQNGASWQDIEATLHCIRYSSEAVPLGEDQSLPALFGEQVLGLLTQRPTGGLGEDRLRLTIVCLIQSYEEWFKFHPTHLAPCLSYLVPSLTSRSHSISRSAADALKALCDMCRKKLVEHIGAFSELHGKIGDMGSEEQSKVIQGISSVIQALPPKEAIGPVEAIVNPIIDRMQAAVSASHTNAVEAQPLLIQTINSLTACLKGLSPSDDEIFDAVDDEDQKEEEMKRVRSDERMARLREKIYMAIEGVVGVWNGDSETADAISSLLKHVSPNPPTLISLPPLPLLSLVTLACSRAPSALWFTLASTVILSISAPPSFLIKKKDLATREDEAAMAREEQEKWETVGQCGGRLVEIAQGLFQGEGMKENPDIVEGWFKFCHSFAERYPGVLLRLQPHQVESYIQLGLAGLRLHERFSLKSASDFFVALLSKTRFPSPLEAIFDPLLHAFGPSLLHALILSAGSEGPRSVIPNLAELLAGLVTRVSGDVMSAWLEGVLSIEGFPDPRATLESKKKLKTAILKSRTARRMREALHEFALVSRGLEGTTYGNATAI
ncbi:hypothetical protein C343_00448 [Cryptococcus neoformans C23]|uniref:Importin N-terminal domain-containing protein n=1 Tax=Cryptococcus neoformans (strain H99 / ATCC 208821 / CBS 10515 / FGSC 9487) TaxID=235443 RepID=J9VGU3_CRYN9|nr:hypothetical protein CNAG_00439 [Cryptococcus neoformans var. grubii H99]AUB22015.1 hypothetical protein CKF44_00439 [Cryptococcus neoformans var. grubii]OWZ48025.1 hypothetical protein C343_00448 [Cryptococcus neoformans var. grubii C23]OWZ56998.1 hypothetical protein C353_00456 [Cryptococcus neoformans var. grubii AD1-83a]OWZ58289.1 hypothetical protein C368_00447 [Cryptococcus neoformans var. grubii 125.91]OXG40721.1 hypothetical protein C360_00499 [Cryptococcus neoformans var. grubii Bt|eukprot:XP_012046716.1 hypothetical protein CNAG_00439 [Cryptococcus neoformans var. grubii H99]